MSRQKKQVRSDFRKAVFERDRYRCRVCGFGDADLLDAHHVMPREDMDGGGYVKENGISLCKQNKGCHEKAEEWLKNGKGVKGFDPESLYRLIGSSLDLAIAASEKR